MRTLIQQNSLHNSIWDEEKEKKSYYILPLTIKKSKKPKKKIEYVNNFRYGGNIYHSMSEVIKKVPTTTNVPSSANLVSPTYLNQFQKPMSAKPISAKPMSAKPMSAK